MGYKQPRKLNPVSLFFFLLGFVAIYGLIQFGPPYWRKWSIKEVLADAANRIYPRRFNATDDFISQVERETTKKIRAAGVQDPSLRVEISVAKGVRITAAADYREVIRHPLVNKTTTLVFRPQESVSITPVN